MLYLNQKSGTNIHDNGTINITSNSISNPNFHPKLFVDKDKTWIIFDFKDFKIQLESYSIKSQIKIRWNSHYNLRNWNLEVSNDKSNWIIIDLHKDDSLLVGYNLTANFLINNDNSTNLYRYICKRHLEKIGKMKVGILKNM